MDAVNCIIASAKYNKVGRKCNAQFSLLCGAGGMVGNVHRTKLSDGPAGHCCFSILCNKTRIRSSALFGRKLLVASVRSVEVQIRSDADDSVRIDFLVAHLFKMKNTVVIFFLMPWLPFSRGRQSAGHDKALPPWPFKLRLRGRRFLFITASHEFLFVYQDRLEKNLLQLFTYPENLKWFSTISVNIFDVNIFAEQKQAYW